MIPSKEELCSSKETKKRKENKERRENIISYQKINVKLFATKENKTKEDENRRWMSAVRLSGESDRVTFFYS